MVRQHQKYKYFAVAVCVSTINEDVANYKQSIGSTRRGKARILDLKKDPTCFCLFYFSHPQQNV